MINSNGFYKVKHFAEKFHADNFVSIFLENVSHSGYIFLK